MKRLLPMLLIGCVLLGGCNSNDEQSVSNVSTTSPSTGATAPEQNLIRDTENVKFKYNYPSDEQFSADVYNYTDAEVSKDSYLKLFLNEPACDKETFPNGFREEYTYGDESGAILNRNGILQSVDYYTSQGFSYLVVEDGTEHSDETTEFGFISRKDVTEKLSSTIHDILGLDIQIKINAVTAEQFASDVKAHINNVAQLDDNAPTADKYGTPADFYLVTFVQSIGNVPVEGCYGNAVFTANGMEYLRVYSPVKPTDKASASGSFVNLEVAESLLKDKYDLLFISEPVEVNSAELTYIINEDKLTPVWRFTLADGIGEYYDAYTGKEIVVYTGEGA